MRELVTALPKPGDTFDGVYRIECELGRGQTSATFGAVHSATGARCAVRCWLTDDAAKAAAATREFMRASRETGILAHPSIVEVFSVGEVEGMHYATMEWLEGVSLPVYLDINPAPLSLEETLELLLPCIDGLAEAHAAGIVHGDLRLENIFVCAPTGEEPARTCILHFGYSGTAGQPLVLPRPLSGHSRQFLCPEEMRSDPLDARSDIYAVGVLLYVLLSGEYPFVAETTNDLALEIVAGAWIPLGEHVPRLAVGMQWVVEHAMATELAERYRSLDELLRDLARFDFGVLLPQQARELALPQPSAAAGPALHQAIQRDAAVLEHARRATARRNLVSRAGLLIGIVFAALLVRVLTAHDRPFSSAAVSHGPIDKGRAGALETATHAASLDPAEAHLGDVHEPQILGVRLLEPATQVESAPAPRQAVPEASRPLASVPEAAAQRRRPTISGTVDADAASVPERSHRPAQAAKNAPPAPVKPAAPEPPSLIEEPEAAPVDRPRDPLESMRLQ